MYSAEDYDNVWMILISIQNEPKSTKKLQILKENKDNALLKRILQYTYDNVKYTFGLRETSLFNFDKDLDNFPVYNDLFWLLDDLNTRKITGDEARGSCVNFYNVNNGTTRAAFLLRILSRDQKIGMSVKSFLKVWPDFVAKTKYCRCSVLNEKTIKKIHFPCFVQLKCDGTYREAHVKDGEVSFKTRAGEPYENPVMQELMKDLPNGYYMGEFTIGKADEPDEDRASGNGLINSNNPPFEKIYYTLWDYLTDAEYKGVISQPYWARFKNLQDILNDVNDERLNAVQNYDAETLEDALHITSTLMSHGLEGSVIKDKHMRFKDGTSPEQLKVKLKVDADLRLVGFERGTKGTKYENKNKVLIFESDDGLIKGRTSGMTDKEVDEVTLNPDKYLGTIIAVQFNDLVKAQGHEYYALSHPRFIEFRTDKTETDTLARVLELRDMSKTLK